MNGRRDGDGERARARSSGRCGGGSSRYWHAVVRHRVGRRRRRDPPRRPRARTAGPVARAPRGHRGRRTPCSGTRAMTSRDLRWAVAYQVVAWSALLGDPVGRPEHPGVAAVLHPLPAAVGDGADPLGRHRHRRRRRRLLARAVGADRLRRRQPHRDPHLRHDLDGPVALARAVHQPDRRRGREPRRDDRRAARHPGPARRGRARPRACTRSASASRARSTTPSPRASPRSSRCPAPPRRRSARGDVAAAGERLALIEHTASDNLDEARLIVAELTPGHLQSRTLGEALERLGRGGDQRDRAARRRAGVGGAGAAGRVGRGRHPAHRPGGAVQRAPPRVAPPGSTSPWPTTTPTRWCSTVRDDGLRLRARRRAVRLRPRRRAGPRGRGRRSGAGAQRARRRHDAAPGGAAVIRLLVVDDHPVVRAGMVAVLGEEERLRGGRGGRQRRRGARAGAAAAPRRRAHGPADAGHGRRRGDGPDHRRARRRRRCSC